MKLAEALRYYCVLVFLLLHGIWGLPQDQPSSKTPAGLTLTRCDDIPIDANLGGVLLIDGHVMCPDNNMKWILVTEHSVIRTKDGKGLEMTNVGFVVDPGIHLFFVAPTVILRKNKNTPPHALIQTEGVVDFWTNALHASFTGASPVDRRQLILPVDDGFVYAPERILFSRTAIYAGDPAASAADEESNILPSQIPSASRSIGKQGGVENAAPGSSKTADVTADGDEDTPISDEYYHIEGDETGHTSASPANGGSDSLSLPDSADTATAAAAGTVVDNRGEQADTDQPRNVNTDAEEVGGTAPSDHVSDLDARIALGFSVVDAVDDDAAAIAAAFDHAAAGGAAAAAAAAADVTSADADAAAAADMASAAAGDDGGGTHSGDSDGSTAQLPHPPSASSGLSSSEQTSAAADANGVLDGADVLGQPGGSMVDAEDIGGTVSSNGVPASAARGASAAAFEPASADGDAAADPDATAPAAAAAAAAAAAPVGSTAHWDDNSDTPKTLPLQPGFEEAERATTAVESGGVSSSSDGTRAPPPNAQSVPGRVLKVGEGLRGRVFNSHGTAATYASPMDGSIVLERLTGNGEKPTVLLKSNTKKVARVLERRADIDAEREEEARVAAGGARKSGGTLGKTVMGWLPFGRKGFLERQKRKHARAHLGEVEIHLTNRGKVEVTMDGTEVLSKAGPSFFGYRRKDQTFEYRTCDDGFEVLRRGEHVWGVTAESG